jgi:hypothetical protein
MNQQEWNCESTKLHNRNLDCHMTHNGKARYKGYANSISSYGNNLPLYQNGAVLRPTFLKYFSLVV